MRDIVIVVVQNMQLKKLENHIHHTFGVPYIRVDLGSKTVKAHDNISESIPSEEEIALQNTLLMVMIWISPQFKSR